MPSSTGGVDGDESVSRCKYGFLPYQPAQCFPCFYLELMDWVQGQWVWVRRGREPSGVILVIRRKLGNAVRRNQLKRRLRHICRLLSLGEKGLVVLALPSAMEARFKDLRDELDQLISHL